MKKILGIMILFALPCIAQELESTRGLALAGAMRGTVGLNEAIYYNPATLAFSSKYSIEAHSSFLPSQTNNAHWIYGGSVVDGTSPLFAAGLGYYRKIQQNKDDIEHAFHLAVSRALHRFISVGLTGKYLWSQNTSTENQSFNADLGIFGMVAPRLHAGLVGHNLFGHNIEKHLERQAGLGVRIKTWDFLYTSLDILKTLQGPFISNYSFHGALEIARENGFLVQGGLALSDIPSKNIYGLGAGWSQHKFGIFYAFRNSMDSLRNNIHALTLRVFF